MKTRLLGALVGLAISFILPTFAQQANKPDPQLREQFLEQFDTDTKKYVEAFNNNDATAVAAFFTEDAVFVTSTGPLHGREAIEKWYADLFKKWHPKNLISKLDPNSLRIIGTPDNIAFNGEWSDTLQGQNGEAIQAKGYWSEIDTREGDRWKICVLTGNTTPPGTPSPTTTPSSQ
jgi:uncharacterized protein (TIGR02246 family)